MKKAVALECSQVLLNQKLKNKKLTGYIVNESSYLRKYDIDLNYSKQAEEQVVK